MSKLKPAGDRIIVKKEIEREDDSDEMVGLIAIPKTLSAQTMGKTLQEGTVVEIGHGVAKVMGENTPCVYAVGQTVYWQNNYAQLIPIDYDPTDQEYEYFMMGEKEVIAYL